MVRTALKTQLQRKLNLRRIQLLSRFKPGLDTNCGFRNSSSRRTAYAYWLNNRRSAGFHPNSRIASVRANASCIRPNSRARTRFLFWKCSTLSCGPVYSPNARAVRATRARSVSKLFVATKIGAASRAPNVS